MHQETRSAVESRFRRWSEFKDHMAQVHHIEVKKDGLHAESTNPKPLPKADEL